MKIIHVYPYYNRLGGVEKYLLDTLPYQALAGKDLELMGSQFDPDVQSKYSCRPVPFVQKPAILAAMSFVLAADFLLFFFVRRNTSKVIVHGQGASCFSPDVVTAHSCHKAWFLESLAQLRPMSKAWLKKILNPLHYWTIFVESIQYRRGGNARVVAISNGIKSELQKYFGLAAERISVVHSGVDCEKYNPANQAIYRADIRKRHGLSEQDLVLVFVANEFRRKGLKTLLRGLQLCADPNLKLLVIGKDSPAEFETLADNLGIRKQVLFIGKTPHVDRYYAASDVFVFPTLYEPFGLVATEAMAAGLPVIISELAGAAELMTDGLDCIKLRDPNDPAEVCSALQRLYSTRVRHDMGQKARETALRHQWEYVVKRIDDVYSSV